MKQGTLCKLGTPEDAEFKSSRAGNGIRSGYFQDKPQLGYSFILFDEEKMGRGLKTSYIKEIIEETTDSITFKTNNSIYKLIIH